MGNERSFMQLCGVLGDLIIVPFGSEVMVKWLVMSMSMMLIY